MSLTLDGLDKMRRARTRNPEAAQRAQSKFARGFYSRHPHACRACVGRYVIAWVLFFIFRQRPWWDAGLNHRTYRYKAGTEPDKAGVPLCEKHHGRADRWRRQWEASPMGQYAPMITLARLWLLGYWIAGLVTYAAVSIAGWFTVPYLAAHLVITVSWR